MLADLTKKLRQPAELTPEDIALAVEALIDEKIPAEDKAVFLIALARKGETPGEIAAFARLLREKAEPVKLAAEIRSGHILDVCGTGGDHLNTFNISTTVALVVAAAGVVVAKHGNRAITSQSGSADVLEALGIPIDLTPQEAANSLEQNHFAFFFAQKFHPAFKHIGPARKLCAQRGERTIFNFLGPLLNPVRPTAQLVGVPRPELCGPLAQVLQSLEVGRAMVVCGVVSKADAKYSDELSILGPTHIAEFYHPHGFHESVLSPEHYPLQPATLEDLRGGDKNQNAQIIRELLYGRDRGPKRDAVLLNAGAALFVAGKSEDLIDGWETAKELIDSGAAAKKLEQLAKRV